MRIAQISMIIFLLVVKKYLSRGPEARERMQTTVMINTCFGGFGFSDKAIEEYNRRNVGKPPVESSQEIQRTDLIMINIVKQMKKEANGPFASIHLMDIPAKFENHYEIRDYDGTEAIDILYDRYAVDSIRDIMASDSLSNGEKVDACRKIMDENAIHRVKFGE